MIKQISLAILIAFFSLTLMTCSGSSTSDDGSGGNSTTKTGAAVAALFGTGSGSDAGLVAAAIARGVAKLATKNQGEEDDEDMEGEGGERNTCDDPDDDGMSDGPEEIEAPLTGTAGEYGDPNNSITVTADDFCQDDEGENTGDGTDGGGLFASYSLTSEVTGTCDDDSTITMDSGEGIWRNTEDCFPQIYGMFVIDGTEVNCSICLAENQNLNADNSSCSTGDGSAITLDTDVTCTLSTEGGGGEDPEDMDGEGGDPMGEDEEDV